MPRPQPAPHPRPSATPPDPARAGDVAPEGSYGPVQRAETLWAIAERFRPDGVSMNQMMVAVYRANPRAFGGNMNVLHIGAVPHDAAGGSELDSLAARDANSEVQRQTDAWQNRAPSQDRALAQDRAPAEPARLVLVPPAEASPAPASRATAPEPVVPAPAPTRAAVPAPEERPPASSSSSAVVASASDDGRPLAIESEQLQGVQQRLDGESSSPAPVENAAPGVTSSPSRCSPTKSRIAAARRRAGRVHAGTRCGRAGDPRPEPSLVSQSLGLAQVAGALDRLGVAALLLAAVLLRAPSPSGARGRHGPLGSARVRGRRRRGSRGDRADAPAAARGEHRRRGTQSSAAACRAGSRRGTAPRAAPRSAAGRASGRSAPAEETLSSQTVINLDQADPVAEADFHMAYGFTTRPPSSCRRPSKPRRIAAT